MKWIALLTFAMLITTANAQTAKLVGQSCSVDLECGFPQYVPQGNQTTEVSFVCRNNECQQQTRIVACDPTTLYPANMCPQDRPVCDRGNRCIERVVTKAVCPTQCCPTTSNSFFEKNCPTGLVCASIDGQSGNCRLPPANAICGDGIVSEGESCNTCPADVRNIGENFCQSQNCPPNYYYYFTTTTSGQCIPQEENNSWWLIVGILIILAGAVLWKYFQKK